MKKNIFPPIAIIIAALLWAVEGIVFMPSLYYGTAPEGYRLFLDAGFIVLMIHLIGFIFMQPFLFREYKQLKKFSGSDWLFMFLIAFFGGAVGTIAIVKALSYVHFIELSVVVLLQKLQPVFAILLALLILKEKPKKTFYPWALLAVFASYFLTFGFSLPNFNTGASTIYAALFALLAAVSFASGTVFGRKLAVKYNFKTLTFFRYGFTTVIMIIYILITGKIMQAALATKTNWAILFLIPLITGIGSMLLYYIGLKKVKASIATMCELFFPVSAIILDFFINKNVLSLVQWISAIVMLFAITRISMDR